MRNGARIQSRITAHTRTKNHRAWESPTRWFFFYATTHQRYAEQRKAWYNVSMATSQSFIDFVCEQLEGVGAIRWIRMMGEACVYVDGKPIVLICNDTIYIKKLPCLDKFEIKESAIPYKGATERYIVDADDKEILQEVVRLVAENTPPPKPKKRKEQ